jgi:hypothetical protein
MPWVPVVLLGLYLLFAHGCHLGDHDVDDELALFGDHSSAVRRQKS